MSITPTMKTRSTRAKIALVPVLSLGLLGGSMAMAAPVQAETSRHGCTVDPRDPENLRGDKVDFKIKVDCNGKKSVQIRQLRYEEDRGHDDFLGGSHFYEHFDKKDGARTVHSVDHVPDQRKDSEAVYHYVSFRVKDDKGHWSNWTKWEKSDVVKVR